MMSAAKTPGIHPKHVRIRTMSTEPQPRSITAKGGNITANITSKHDIVLSVFSVCYLFRGAKIQHKIDIINDFAKYFLLYPLKY